MLRALPAMCLLCAGALIATPVAADELWAVRSGEVVFHFNVPLLRDLGIELTVEAEAGGYDGDIHVEDPHWAFPIRKNSDFRFNTAHGSVLGRGLVGGVIRLDGVLTFRDRTSGKKIRFDDLEIARVPAAPLGPLEKRATEPLQLRSAATGLVLFELANSMFAIRPNVRALRIHYLNARIAEPWAQEMGQPELAGWVVGVGELSAGAVVLSATPPTSPPDQPVFEGGVLDVSLGDLSSIQQVGHEGVYPTGGVALSMATTSCNVGAVDVPWLAPMQENHPVIHMAIYRLMNGRFEQIGVSWLKHGFFALSDNQCMSCQHPSNGTFLGVGCSDTYGVGNNSSRTYLGPRSEVNPYAATWECTGSHFSGGVGDCTRRHGSESHGPLDHRLIAADADLGNAGGTYYYEADYLVQGDQNLANNWGSRRCTMSWSGSAWNFTTPVSGNPLVEGPALGRWGELSTLVDAAVGDGQVLLAVQTTNLGGGTTHYEYALLNQNSDRQIRSFSMPVHGVTTLSNIGFHDNDSNASNDWQVAVNNGEITWQTGSPQGTTQAHPLEFGFMFNFRFDADAPPSAASARLELYKPGPGSLVMATTLGPLNVQTAVGELSRPTAQLIGVRPNPSSRSATISFEMAASTRVKLDIHDAAGRLVRHLIDESREVGAHFAIWDGMDNSGARARAGVYHARLQVGDATAVRALIVMD